MPAQSSLQEPDSGESRILKLVKRHLRIAAEFIEHSTYERRGLSQLPRGFDGEDVRQLRSIRIELVALESPELGVPALAPDAGLDGLESGLSQQACEGIVIV